MKNLEKLIEKYALIDTGYTNPIDAEDFLLAVKDSEFLILKESGELIVNLPSYVSRPGTKKALFEDELFLNHIFTAVRLLDNGVDVRLEQIIMELRKIKEKGSKRKRFKKAFNKLLLESSSLNAFRAIEIRFIGVDVMARSLGVKPEHLDAFTAALDLLKLTSIYSASIELAVERGSFKEWDFKSIEANPFLRNFFDTSKNELMTEDILQKVANSGIRNLITIKNI